MKTICSLVIAFFTAVTLPGHAASLTTTFVTGGHIADEGMMFDVIAVRAMTITGIQIAFEEAPLTSVLDIYTKPNSFVGSETVAADWTLNTTVGALTVSAVDTPSPLVNLATPVALAAGERRAFYYVRDAGAGPNISATAGTAIGNVAASDGNLLILEGSEIDGVFTAIGGANIIPDITIHYTLTDTAAPTITLIGKQKVFSTSARTVLFGIAEDDVAVASVTAKFKKVLPNGSRRTVTKTLTPLSNGLFKLSLKSQPGRTNVKFTAVDTSGKVSATTTAIVIGS